MTRFSSLLLMTILTFPVLPTIASAELPKTIETAWRGDAGLDDAATLLKDKKFAEVLNATDKMMARNIRNTDAHVLAASAWYSLGNMDKAKNAITNALSIDQGHMGAYTVAALIALRQKEKHQAEYYLNAMQIACQGTGCPEYQYVLKAVREYKE